MHIEPSLRLDFDSNLKSHEFKVRGHQGQGQSLNYIGTIGGAGNVCKI